MWAIADFSNKKIRTTVDFSNLSFDITTTFLKIARRYLHWFSRGLVVWRRAPKWTRGITDISQ